MRSRPEGRGGNGKGFPIDGIGTERYLTQTLTNSKSSYRDGGLQMTQEQKGDRQPGQISLLGTASTMGLHMVSGPVVGGVLGWLVDKWLDTWPAGAAVGLLLGLAAGFRNVWIDARYLARSNAARDAAEKARRDAGQQERERQRRQSPSAPDPARAALIPDSAASLTEAEGKAERSDDLTASILAGTADPSERDLDALDETLEAIRRELKDEGRNGKQEQE